MAIIVHPCSEYTCAGKFLLVLMGGRAEGLACADPGARTPIAHIVHHIPLILQVNDLNINHI